MSLNAEAAPNSAADTPAVPRTHEDILTEARKRYRLCSDAENKNNILALSDLKFLVGGENQWDAEAVRVRTLQGRPMITVNTMPTYLHQVTNEQRQNSPSIKVHPVGSGADVGTAKVRQGMIRHIEYDSNADVAYDRAVNSAAAIGKGFFLIVPEYENESSFNQKLMFKSVRNALSIRIDPLSTEPDGSDMKYAFQECLTDKKEFTAQHPKANASSSTILGDGTNDYTGWITENTVLVCNYYSIEKTPATAIELSDGDTGFKEDLAELPAGVKIVRERPSYKCKVMWRKITAVDVLEETEIKCKWIPVFPVYGDEIDIEGEVIRAGIIRNAKGPAQSYNVMMTAATEEVASRSKSPYIMAEGQEEGHEAEWQASASIVQPYITYKPATVGTNLAPPPQRQPMADVPVGMLAMAMHARDNVKATTGLFDSSLGAKGTATSGIQEREQQHQGEVANFHFTDGLLRSLRHAGRCIDYMIPHYYDAQRVVAIMSEDGSVESAEINAPNEKMEKGEDGEIRAVLNDMSGGEYTATVESGPNYTTMREEAAQFFTDAIKATGDPRMAAVITYLAVKYQDIPGAEEAAEMLQKLLPPEVQETDDQDGEVIQTSKGPLPVAQVPAALAAMEQQIAQMGEALKKADADGKAADAGKVQIAAQKEEREAKQAEIDGNLDLHRVQVEEKNAETARLKAETERIKVSQESDDADAKNFIAAQQLRLDTRIAEMQAIQGDTSALEAFGMTLESETRRYVADVAARSGERKAEMAAAAAARRAAEKQKPTKE